MAARCPACETYGAHKPGCALRGNPDIQAYEKQIDELGQIIEAQRQELAKLNDPAIRETLARIHSRDKI